MTTLNGNGVTLTAVRPDIFKIYLHDEDGQNILSIDDGALRQSLRIEIVNTSGKSIEFQSVDNQPTLKNYHFCISFRPGTLLLTQDEDKIITLKETDEGWQMQQQDNTFYLLLNNAVPKVINNGERITLTLENIGAAPGGGSRRTRVEIKYNYLQYQGSNETISGNRLQYLNIVNHRGKKQIPLYVGFIGSNTILNDATENELTLTIQTLHGLSASLQLANENETDVQIDHDKPTEGGLSLRGRNDGSLDEATKFTISFDVASTESEAAQNWALVNTNDSDNIHINITKGEENWIDAGKEKLGITPQWSFICKQGGKQTSRQEILRLNISNIKTQLLAGYANLYIHYDNIPGYWDGYITVPIHKGPLVYREKTSGNNKVGCVGIGTDEPQAKLHVKSANGVDGLKVDGNTVIAGQLSVNGDVGIGTTDPEGNKLKVQGNTQITNDLKVNGTTSTQILRVDGWSRSSHLNNVDGAIYRKDGQVYITVDDNLYIRDSGGTGDNIKMHFNTNNGNLHVSSLSIGTPDPEGNKLKVQGNTAIAGNLHVSSLSIGTPNPEGNQLKVQGNTAIAGQLSVTNGNAAINNVFLGEVGFGSGWASFSNINSAGKNSYALSQYESGTYTLINKKSGGGYIGFRVDNRTKMTINDNGNVGIGVQDAGAKLEVYGDLKLRSHDNEFKMYLGADGSHKKNLIFEIRDSRFGQNRYSKMRWDGDTNWDSVSDLSLKTDIENEGNILSRLMQLDVKNYCWKDNPQAQIKTIGFIAQDVQPLFPALVGEWKDKDGNQEPLTLKYASFGVLAVGGLKELKREKDAEIAKLKTEMEAEINNLKTQIQQLSKGK